MGSKNSTKSHRQFRFSVCRKLNLGSPWASTAAYGIPLTRVSRINGRYFPDYEREIKKRLRG